LKGARVEMAGLGAEAAEMVATGARADRGVVMVVEGTVAADSEAVRGAAARGAEAEGGWAEKEERAATEAPAVAAAAEEAWAVATEEPWRT
jgi:hypothetical protein